MESTKTTNKKFIIIGFSASLLLLILYFSILSLAESFSHAIQQFSRMWYWILILVVGFGLQVGLYFYIRESIRLKQMTGPTTAVTASGGVSTGAMVACCLHHVTDVLPLMGLAAAAVFLTQYQLWFIILGILSNLIGISIMLEIIQKHSLSEGFLRRILIYNMNRVKKIAIVSSVFLLALSFLLIKNSGQASLSDGFALSSRSNDSGGLSVEVTPVDFAFGKPLEFKISFETHQGDLNYNFKEKAVLIDDQNNRFLPLEWQGGSGGHHLTGTLVFPPLTVGIKSIKLKMLDIYGVAERNFSWELK